MNANHVRRALAGVGLVVALGLSGATVAVAAPEAEAKPAAAPTHTIDLNTASVEQLTEVPGIGQTLAERIVEFRQKEGPFRSVEDLMKVRGIGEKSFEKMKPWFTVKQR
jgi:competence protein ComEA